MQTERQAEGRTEMTTLIGAFRKFVNGSKRECRCRTRQSAGRCLITGDGTSYKYLYLEQDFFTKTCRVGANFVQIGAVVVILF
jgi:hypothetical protein